MSRTKIALVIAVVVLLAAASGTAAPEQQPGNANATSELLAEVRLLRQAIEHLAGNGARVQIVFGRLQLQEQRTATAARRVEELRRETTRLSREIETLSGHLKELESRASDTRRTAEEQENARAEIAHLNRAIAAFETDRARQLSLESEAVSQLTLDQATWADLNRQLEELERALARPRTP